MSHVSTPWTLLASRVARGVLSRKGFTLKQLFGQFSALRVIDTARGIDGKIARGTYSLAFFLQLLRATRSEYPSQWVSTVSLDIDFEEQAAHIVARELATQGIDVDDLVRRLAGIGVQIAKSEVAEQMVSGTFSFVFFLQFAAVANINGIERFVDSSDITEAAIMSARREN